MFYFFINVHYFAQNAEFKASLKYIGVLFGSGAALLCRSKYKQQIRVTDSALMRVSFSLDE